MTPYELKRRYYEHNPNGHFFDPKTMKFFGDTMKNYGVTELQGYYCLYRKHPVKQGLQCSSWFDKETFEENLRPKWRCERCGEVYQKEYGNSKAYPHMDGKRVVCIGCLPMPKGI
jgi:hypothetical protein